MKHNFEERKQNRIDYAQEQARKNQAKSEALSKSASEMASHIPFGQPILVGHHSEKRDRNYRAKIGNTFQRSVDAGNKASHYRNKVKTIKNNRAISSDDPEALEKIDEKIAQLEKLQSFMKQANVFVRKGNKEGFLKLEWATEETWEQLNKPDCFGGLGFASYKLTNNSANIRRLKQRREQLAKLTKVETKTVEIEGVKLVHNVEANRVQLVFEGIPSEEVRSQLKKRFHFRWCRSEGAWQRHLNNAGIYSAKDFLAWYGEHRG
ncbi:DUF3560 domain-containing protein [Fluviicola sp.]|uniref:DUF3560 domain-containing protein n=1 Tax=Fluviicola sp. TaxID=1917219 RepID=UPI0031DD59FF